MIFKDGNFTRTSTTILGGLGIALVLAALKYAETRWQFFTGIFLGIFLIAIASASSKAYVLKVKPFTNDPLGWRKAKKSYETQEDSDKATTKSDQP